jgi:hypothetical protein
MTNEGSAGDSTHKFTEFSHKRNRLASVVLSHSNKFLQIFIIDFILARKIAFESLAGEQTIKSLAEINTGKELALQTADEYIKQLFNDRPVLHNVPC